MENAKEVGLKRRILIVDDDPSIRHMLARVLVNEGFEPFEAANGEAGLVIAADAGVELVLLDLKMPGMSGEETLKELSARHPGLPVVVITAHPRPKGEVEAMDAFLQKPLDFQVLLETIRNLLARKDKNG